MGATTNNTKRTMEVGTEDATEARVKKVEEVDATPKTAELHSTPNNENHSTGNQTGKEKKPTNPTETLRETLERQRKTTALIMNKNPREGQAKQQEKPPKGDTRTNPETAPPIKPPVQYDGGSQTQTFIPREGRTPPGQNNALGYNFFIPQDSEFGNSILPVIPRTRDLINITKDKNNNGETTTTASGDNNKEAKELDNAIKVLINAQREVTNLINNTKTSTKSKTTPGEKETQPPREASKGRDQPTNETKEDKDISSLFAAMRKAKDIYTLINTMEEAQKKARNLITATKEKNDIISNPLEEARREALNLINSTTTRNPDSVSEVRNMAAYKDH